MDAPIGNNFTPEKKTLFLGELCHEQVSVVRRNNGKIIVVIIENRLQNDCITLFYGNYGGS